MSETPRAELSAPLLVRLVAREGPPLGLIFAAIGAAGTLAVGLLHLDRLPFSLCYLKLSTGLPCPTCGSTRALGRLFALDLPGAFRMNPATTLAFLALAFWGVADLVLLPQRKVLGIELGPRTSRVLRLAAVLVVLGNWVYLLANGR